MNLILYSSNQSLSINSFKTIEKNINFVFPRDYVDFILRFNGGLPSIKSFKDKLKINRSLLCFLSVDNDKNSVIQILNRLKLNYFQLDFIPFACDNNSNYYVFRNDKIFLWHHSFRKTEKEFTYIADNFDEFLKLLECRYKPVEIIQNKIESSFKTYQGKDYTKEEWKKFEEEEYRKYVEKRSGKKSSFLADDTEELEKQNFSAESGTLKEVKYFVMNSRQDKVPVYEFPSAMVAPFTFLENGTAVEVIKYEQNGWCEILSKDKKKAYIQSTHVKKNE